MFVEQLLHLLNPCHQRISFLVLGYFGFMSQKSKESFWLRNHVFSLTVVLSGVERDQLAAMK